MQYFHSGLRFACRKNLDAAAGGSIDDLTPDEAWSLIEKIINNDQQYGGYDARQVHEVFARSSQDHNTLSSQVASMNAQINNLAAQLSNTHVQSPYS